MNATRANIRKLAPNDFRYGRCEICNGLCELHFRDASTGIYLGECCLKVTIAAERELFNVVGLRHPTLEESIATPNH